MGFEVVCAIRSTISTLSQSPLQGFSGIPRVSREIPRTPIYLHGPPAGIPGSSQEANIGFGLIMVGPGTSEEVNIMGFGICLGIKPTMLTLGDGPFMPTPQIPRDPWEFPGRELAGAVWWLLGSEVNIIGLGGSLGIKTSKTHRIGVPREFPGSLGAHRSSMVAPGISRGCQCNGSWE